MYERLTAAPGTLAIRLGETLTVEEIDRLYAEAADELASHDRLNYFVDATHYSHSGLDAGLHGLKLRFAHLDWFHRFQRVAIVTDNAIHRAAVAMLDLMTPMMEVRPFASTDVETALAWVEGAVEGAAEGG